MKVGDDIICISNFSKSPRTKIRLTIGKKYKILKIFEGNRVYKVLNDENVIMSYNRCRFISIEKNRNKLINYILE